jgi:hypothetical protein
MYPKTRFFQIDIMQARCICTCRTEGVFKHAGSGTTTDKRSVKTLTLRQDSKSLNVRVRIVSQLHVWGGQIEPGRLD